MSKSFQRARQPGQKAQRRAQILAAARALLRSSADLADLSLTALADRAGMAKSNLYRYFESREAVLLAVLEAEWEDWADDLLPGLAPLDPDDDDALAALMAKTAQARPTMCELVSAMPSVLEHNVSTETIASFKARSLSILEQVAAALADARPVLTADQYAEFLHHGVTMMIGLWPVAHPSPLAQEVLAAEEMAPFRHDFETDLRRSLTLLLRGLRTEALS